MTSGKPRRQYFLGLDIIRIFAALLVLFFHLSFWIWQDPRLQIPNAYATLVPFTAQGWVGVEIFFVLSGFVIAYSAIGQTPSAFVGRRVKRLWPSAVVCATLTSLVLLTAYPLHNVLPLWVRSTLLLPVGPWVDGVYWTLPVEIAFYALVLFELFLSQGRYLLPLMAVIGMLSTCTCLINLLQPSWIPARALGFTSRLNFPPQACSLMIYGTFFALGVFLFSVLFDGLTASRLVAVLLNFVGCIGEIIWHSRAITKAERIAPIQSPVLPLILWVAAILTLVTAIKFSDAVSEFFGSKCEALIRRAGMATYPLYLLHAKIGQVGIGGFHRRVGYGPALILSALCVCGLSVFVSSQVEPKMRAAMVSLWRPDVPR